MQAIIDGGTTKADWKIVRSDNEVISATTTGFNPNYDSTMRIAELLRSELSGVIEMNAMQVVHYYGAGCWDEERNATVRKAFNMVFPTAVVNVHHDLLAAARATCGTEPGIACILGTGSNSVLYDGAKEIDNVNSLGFILGDEGSGGDIGRQLVKAYFYREMPAELHPVMESACPNGKTDILNQVYSGGVPAAYLASFCTLFYEHRHHPFVWQTIKNCFREFFHRHVFKYTHYRGLPIHFVGSIAYYFNDILKECMEEENLKMGVVLKKPIDELLKYHLTFSKNSETC